MLIGNLFVYFLLIVNPQVRKAQDKKLRREEEELKEISECTRCLILIVNY